MANHRPPKNKKMIKIENKFNVGDNIAYINDQTRVVEDKVRSISVSITANESTVWYHTANG